MPSKVCNLRVPREVGVDRRMKLSEEQKQEIKENPEGKSQRALAREYGVSRKSIQFILDPEKLRRSKELYMERRKDGRYYDKAKHTECTHKHRKHKEQLVREGKI